MKIISLDTLGRIMSVDLPKKSPILTELSLFNIYEYSLKKPHSQSLSLFDPIQSLLHGKVSILGAFVENNM